MSHRHVLIDTSAWIPALRESGAPDIRRAVWETNEARRTALCDIVMLELWAGVRPGQEEKVLRGMEQTFPVFETTTEVWATACSIARKARKKGVTVPATDLLIFAVAEHYGLDLLHRDAHFDTLESLEAS